VTTSSEIQFPTASIRTPDYIRQRIEPSRFDLNYLHLKDLLELVRSVSTTVRGDIFDYGCGAAPYRNFFSNCKSYVSADVNPGPQVDRVLRTDGTTEESEESFDLIFSTQVLEHVRDPRLYLRECHRILRSGGQLLLTTHGMIEEHGAPWDFHRWTATGLQQLVESSGFRVIESAKVTTEIRAAIQLMHQMQPHLRSGEKRLVHLMLAVIRRIYSIIFVPALNWFADLFPGQSRVPGTNSSSLYVCLYVRAEKSK
jgi:SAM-dependent methyltransferase